MPASIPPTTSALPLPATPDPLAPGAPVPGRDPRRFPPKARLIAPHPPGAPPAPNPPVVSQQVAPLPPPIEVRPAPLPAKPKPRPPLVLTPPPGSP
jgi:large subunit ribosomal protein L24